MHLDRALLKQSGMLPWEILVSESQERMTLAVSEGDWERLAELAAFYEVEIVSIGTFTDSGRFHVLYNGETVANLTLDFLHHGLPRMELEAEWIPPVPPKQPELSLHDLLRSPNICSKESVVRQYDHEVQGGSVLKPLVGLHHDGPSDAAVFFPVEDPSRGIVLSHGICPSLSDYDAYNMAANAVDEAVRNAVAVGADPDKLAILDNFCWPDPVYDPVKNPDGKYKLAQLVRANKALYDAALAYETPIISGKDSMKNDYIMDGVKISIPPTLLVSAIGVIESLASVISMDVKSPGDLVYLIGKTTAHHKVDFEEGRRNYRALHQAIRGGLVASCHDVSDGGLAVALAEMAFAGGYGIEAEAEDCFVESPGRLVATVAPENAEAFERCVANAARIGAVRSDNRFKLGAIDESIEALKASWQGGCV